MYLHSRTKRWLGVLQKAQSVMQLAKRTVDGYAEAATRMSGMGVISERDQQVMTLPARDSIALTFESQRLGGNSWLAGILDPVSQALKGFSFGAGFSDSVEALKSAAEATIPLLQQRITEAESSIDEIVEELERAFLISLVVTLTSHNVLLKKVAEWERPHERFLQGHLPEDVGHYFDVKTLTYVGTGGPGRIHMQDLVLAVDAGVTVWMAVGGSDNLDNYPEVQAVAYAQWFTYAFALWEEQFRGRIATYFDKRCDDRIRRSDVLYDYFGDVRLIRNDFVHNKGICKESADLKLLQQWGLSRGQPIEITAEQMMSLIDLFPRDKLRTAPTPQPPGEMQKVPGKVDPHLLEDVQQRAQQLELTDDELANAALSAWLTSNS
ncbi:hypothetical protein [Mycobacterium camsae]|uniref:hypothetical protein n=1 Tax=Mycobacterium gordonae TaxID=1778 RepID=UPI001F12036A|nr:hypothetical protein [Mycobacterium gordonae]